MLVCSECGSSDIRGEPYGPRWCGHCGYGTGARYPQQWLPTFGYIPGDPPRRPAETALSWDQSNRVGDPTEELNPAHNPGLARFAAWLGVDYLVVASAFLHTRDSVNACHIDTVRQAIGARFGDAFAGAKVVEKLSCPNCGHTTANFEFLPRETGRTGHYISFALTCPHCRTGFGGHFERLR